MVAVSAGDVTSGVPTGALAAADDAALCAEAVVEDKTLMLELAVVVELLGPV